MKSDVGRIGVLMGGPSSEREISLKSGKAIENTLKAEGYDVTAIDITDDCEVTLKKIKSAEISVAFVALHGRFGEDGTIQSILESLQIPYTGSGVAASRLGMDKIASREIFQRNNIPVPRYLVINKNSKSGSIKNIPFAFPVVVKPSSNGSSIGLSIVEDKNAFIKAVDLACQYDDKVVIEEYIDGKEITVGILDDRPLPVIQIIPKKKFFDYQAKYQDGLTEYIVPAPIPKRQYERAQEIGLLAHQVLGCRSFSRVDMILNQRGDVVVLEINTIPGLTCTSLLPKAARASGIEFNQLCVKIIESAMSPVRKSDIFNPVRESHGL